MTVTATATTTTSTVTIDYPRYLVDVTVRILQSIEGRNGRTDYSGYVTRLFQATKISYSVLLTALLYLLRLRTRLSEYPIPGARDSRFVSLQFATAIIIACKYLHDRHRPNSAWANILVCTVSDINGSERAFLSTIEYRLFVPKRMFDRWTALLFQPQRLRHYGLVPASTKEPMWHPDSETTRKTTWRRTAARI